MFVLQRIDDAVDGSIGLLPEDAPAVKSYRDTCSKSRRVRCSSARTSASSRTRSLGLFWTREDLDEHHLVCIVIARNPRHYNLFWIIKSSIVLIFRPAGIKCDNTTQPSLATQPNTITEAGFLQTASVNALKAVTRAF